MMEMGKIISAGWSIIFFSFFFLILGDEIVGVFIVEGWNEFLSREEYAFG